MTVGDWIGIGALATTVLVGVLGYLRKPSFVAVHRLEELQARIDEFEEQEKRLRDEIQRLRQANSSLELGRAFWQDEYQRAVRHSHKRTDETQ